MILGSIFHFEEKIELIAPHPIGRIGFDGCRVPLSNLLGEEAEGFKIAMTTLDTFRPTVGSAAVGLAWRALDDAISYSKKDTEAGRVTLEFRLHCGSSAGRKPWPLHFRRSSA